MRVKSLIARVFGLLLEPGVGATQDVCAHVGKAGFQETLRIHKEFLPFKNSLVVLPVPMRSDPNFLAFPKSMHMKPWLATFNQVIKKGCARGDIPKIIA